MDYRFVDPFKNEGVFKDRKERIKREAENEVRDNSMKTADAQLWK